MEGKGKGKGAGRGRGQVGGWGGGEQGIGLKWLSAESDHHIWRARGKKQVGWGGGCRERGTESLTQDITVQIITGRTGQLATNILPTQKPPLGERTVVGRCGGERLP